jgi:hypothetical protein
LLDFIDGPRYMAVLVLAPKYHSRDAGSSRISTGVAQGRRGRISRLGFSSVKSSQGDKPPVFTFGVKL